MPHELSGLVASVMAHARTTHRAIDDIRQRWARMVGAPLAACSRPVSVRRGVLAVEADDSGAAYTLSLRQPQILKQLEHDTPPVTEMVIRAGGRSPRSPRSPQGNGGPKQRAA